ncbi:putative metalloprotease CJM1_0395 family protein [Azonexus sp.]|uniref:putative metalloprotease CJM1_0395 family protein n=1 Tax=Azonexus sp. TaxID=1872668 RepID=UPI0039E50210
MDSISSASINKYWTPQAADGLGRGRLSAGEKEEKEDKAQTREGLSAEQQAEVDKLQKIDREVRQHEMAHMAAGAGMVTSGASYTYTRGPDGMNYAVAGEVGIDTSPGRTPEETIARAERIQAAALAPADPSPQDRSVAAQASQMAAQARQEIAVREKEGGEQDAPGDVEDLGGKPVEARAGQVAAGQVAAGQGADEPAGQKTGNAAAIRAYRAQAGSGIENTAAFAPGNSSYSIYA